MSPYLRLLYFLKPHWKRVAIGLTALIAGNLVGQVPPLVIRGIIDNVIWNKIGLDTPERISKLWLYMAILLGLHLSGGLLQFIRTYVMHVLGEQFILDLRKRTYEHLQKLSLNYYESRQTGEIMSRVTNDTEVVEEFVTHAADTLVGDVLRLLVSIGILFYLSAHLAIAAMVPVPFLAVVTYFYSRKIRRIYRKVRERLAEINARLQDSLSGMRVIKSFNNEDYEYKRFTREADEFFSMRLSAIRLWAPFRPFAELIVSFGTLTVIGYGSYLVVNGTITPGTLIAYMAYMMSFYGPVNNLARITDSIQRSLAAADRIFEVLDTEPDIKDASGAREMPVLSGRVEFDNVCFRYSTGDEVLKDINIVADPGETVALVGRSGAGKSSIINLIPRFYDTTEGRVLLDGIDVRTVTQASLRSQIAMVLQDTFLFNGTIRDNIAYGKLSATDEEIETAAKVANAHEFIATLPEGYLTEIGERGVKLSGGQRQRLSIARAVLADPKILILDEATSNVDSESEYLIHRAMDRLMKNRTTFVIAHRLSTVKGADKIVTLDCGRVVEMGDHRSLLSSSGVYSEMYEMQYKLDEDQEEL